MIDDRAYPRAVRSVLLLALLVAACTGPVEPASDPPGVVSMPSGWAPGDPLPAGLQWSPRPFPECIMPGPGEAVPDCMRAD